MEKDKGILITFEGGEGSGTTTLTEWLAKKLQEECYEVVRTREPGGTVISERIREILLDRRVAGMVSGTEALLFLAARFQVYSEVVLPSLAADKTVLLDRSGDSTLAYQGYGRELDMALLRMLNTLAMSGRVPDLTILCDCLVEVGRARKKPGELNRLDVETLTFLNRVRKGYLTLAHAEPERWFVVDAVQPLDVVKRLVWERVAELLKLK